MDKELIVYLNAQFKVLEGLHKRYIMHRYAQIKNWKK